MNGNDAAGERRAYLRLNLRWPVLLCAHEAPGQPVWAKTENISSSGFCCLSPEPFRPGERLSACLLLPRLHLSDGYYPCLQCEVEVVHITLGHAAGGPHAACGMGCRIHAYLFRRDLAEESAVSRNLRQDPFLQGFLNGDRLKPELLEMLPAART